MAIYEGIFVKALHEESNPRIWSLNTNFSCSLSLSLWEKTRVWGDFNWEHLRSRIFQWRRRGDSQIFLQLFKQSIGIVS